MVNAQCEGLLVNWSRYFYSQFRTIFETSGSVEEMKERYQPFIQGLPEIWEDAGNDPAIVSATKIGLQIAIECIGMDYGLARPYGFEDESLKAIIHGEITTN